MLYQIEHEINKQIEKEIAELDQSGPIDGTIRRQPSEEFTYTVRQERSRPLVAKFSEWLETVAGQVRPKSPIGEAIAYARSNWTALTRYLDAGFLSIDNNAAERAMRPIALGRKNWLQVGSEKGGRTAAVLLSIVQTCQALKVEPFVYLRDVLDRVSTHPASRIAELLPDAWTAPQS